MGMLVLKSKLKKKQKQQFGAFLLIKILKMLNVVIQILKENLELINNGAFDFIFTEEPIFEEKNIVDLEEKKLSKNRKKRSGGLIAAMFLSVSLGIGLIGFQQSFFTNSIQVSAQEKFEEIFTNESPLEEIYERKAELTSDLVTYEEPAGIFPEIREILNLRKNNSDNNYDTSLFGFLEISEIELEQYVVIGTSEVDLQL